jgi:hypothetical protein
MSKGIPATTRLIVTAFLLMAGVFAGTHGLSAQGTPAAMGGETPHPAHIHSGTCMELGDVVYPLTDVAGPDAMASPSSSPAAMDMMDMDEGTPMAGMDESAEVVATSMTDVEAALDDILAAEHAINVHESAENIGNYIACGDVTGEVTDGTLEIELQELNGSGYSGEAYLVDNGDGTTTVTVTLMKSESGMTGTPEASPSN